MKGINYAAWTNTTIDLGTNYRMVKIFSEAAYHCSADGCCGDVLLGRILVYRTPEYLYTFSLSFEAMVKNESGTIQSN